MSPKQKAAQLRYKYSILLDLNTTDGLVLQCALVSIHEILRLGKKLPLEILEYYLEVKKEIEKI